MELLLKTDQDWFLFLNSLHVDWLDPVMFWITKTWIWLPLYIFLLALSIKTDKKASWMILIGIALVILFADQVTSSVMKPFFARLRPSHDPALDGLVHLVNDYRGGLYGFASGHAANTFGTALYFWLVFRDKYKWISFLFLWAIAMTYTRIYLGVHYPGDILCGILVGCIGAFIGYSIYKSLKRRFGDASIVG